MDADEVEATLGRQHVHPLEGISLVRHQILERLYFAYRDGNLAALCDAICYCVENELPPPEWIRIHSIDFFRSALSGELGGRTGPRGSPLARAKGNIIDKSRFDAVEEVRERQRDPDWLRHVSLVNDPKLDRVTKDKLLRSKPLDPGKSWEDAFRVAAEILKGSPAFASPATIRNSYLRVRKCTSSYRYHYLSPATRRWLFGEQYLNV
jgi:hypothetical protein